MWLWHSVKTGSHTLYLNEGISFKNTQRIRGKPALSSKCWWLSGSDGNHFNPYPAGNEREEGKAAVKKIHGEGTSGKGNETASW